MQRKETPSTILDILPLGYMENKNQHGTEPTKRSKKLESWTIAVVIHSAVVRSRKDMNNPER
ncbi:hypothetical protein M514_05669 [Trichuris suis]|uniref:Uncharacterized protein n=1 Tax=Trichuris suis TaxID=68888 RepID=A0A085M859_9BILA|nr:hypothetical protein M513_05669 [Trichuris suis]KFD61969.1 hypothetical protein M514_05669 [Trichuris suis]